MQDITALYVSMQRAAQRLGSTGSSAVLSSYHKGRQQMDRDKSFFIRQKNAPVGFESFSKFLESKRGGDLSEGQWSKLFAMCKVAQKSMQLNVQSYRAVDGYDYNPFVRQVSREEAYYSSLGDLIKKVDKEIAKI